VCTSANRRRIVPRLRRPGGDVVSLRTRTGTKEGSKCRTFPVPRVATPTPNRISRPAPGWTNSDTERRPVLTWSSGHPRRSGSGGVSSRSTRWRMWGTVLLFLAPLLVSLALKINSLVGIQQAPTSLALVTGTGALLAMFANPFFGRMSDRTSSRLAGCRCCQVPCGRRLGDSAGWRGSRVLILAGGGFGAGALAPTLTDATLPPGGATGLLASYGLPFMAKGVGAPS
jgi:hypothetical protein